MNKNPEETQLFFKDFMSKISEEEASNFIFFPPALCFSQALEVLGNTQIGIGVQNVFSEKRGAFTGENSPQVAKDMGATHILVGHSERRMFFNLTDEEVSKDVKVVQSLDMVPLICVGELDIQREMGKTVDVICAQLREALFLLDVEKPFMLAYEPIWAIGTDQVPTVTQIEEAHGSLRLILKQVLDDDKKAESVPILYGGSVNASISHRLFQATDVSGFLVGKASLDPHSFYSIFREATSY